MHHSFLQLLAVVYNDLNYVPVIFSKSLNILFSGGEDFSLGVNKGSDSFPQKLFRMRK